MSMVPRCSRCPAPLDPYGRDGGHAWCAKCRGLIDPATGLPSLDVHRGWHIYFEYPPIPDRRFDYQASDPNGDGEPVAYGRTVEECKADIDRILEERLDAAA